MKKGEYFGMGDKRDVPSSIIASRAPASARAAGKLPTAITTGRPNASVPAGFVSVGGRATIHVCIRWDADSGRCNVLGGPG